MANQRLTRESERGGKPGSPVPIRGAESELAKRLRSVVVGESQVSFARRSQITEALLRQYLAGTMPSTDRLVRMADAGGVSVEWLAAGRGPRERASLAAQARLDDVERLRTVLAAVEEGLRASGRTLPPDKYADLVVAAYELLGTPDAQGRAKVLRLIKAVA